MNNAMINRLNVLQMAKALNVAPRKAADVVGGGMAGQQTAGDDSLFDGGDLDPFKLAEQLMSRRETGREQKLVEGASLLGGPGEGYNALRALNQGRAAVGKDVPSTPVNGRTAVEKWIRHGGPKPTAAQFAAAGTTEEDAAEQRAKKVLARQARNAKGQKDAFFARAKAAGSTVIGF